MLPFEFIKSELKNFIIKFPKTRVRYENDTHSNTHSIEVVPNEIYRLDKDYITWEDTFFDTFINEFPDQNICFISDDAIVGLDKIDFELSGKEYISVDAFIPTSYNFKMPSNLSINNIHIKSKNNIKAEITKAYLEPTMRVDLKTNLIQPNTKIVENILNQYNYPLAA
jgi:hypothetical protein